MLTCKFAIVEKGFICNVNIHTYMYACMHADMHTCLLLLMSMLWHRQAIFESKGDKLSSSAECRIRTLSERRQVVFP